VAHYSGRWMVDYDDDDDDYYLTELQIGFYSVAVVLQ
jgi:hypothetical protein